MYGISGAAASAPKDVTARFWVSVHGILEGGPDHVLAARTRKESLTRAT